MAVDRESGVGVAVRYPIAGVSVYRVEQAAGIELRDIARCSQEWWTFCTEIELMVPETFCGDVWYRRRVYQLGPGQIFCATPGEIVRVSRVAQPGSLKILTLDPGRLRSDAATYDVSGAHGAWLPTVTLVPSQQSEALDQVFGALQGLQPLGLLDGALAKLRVSISEGICACGLSSQKLPRLGVTCRCGASERRSQDIGPQILSARADLSRFQADRRFKHRNGLPPHAYSLCVRIARARQLLRSGSSPSQVAAAQGFTDQSHFTRHFKRHVGLTPWQYARPGHARRNRRSQ